MLQQDRINLHADAKATSARLLDREVTYIRSQMSTMATISTFLGGFLYGQVSQGMTSEDDIFDAISKELLIVAFMFNLMAVVSSVLLQVFGPYAALKAQPEKLAYVIRKIREKRRMVLRLFIVGIFCFELSTLSLIWAKWDHNYAIGATVVIVIGDFYMHKIFTGMVRAFKAPPILPHAVRSCCCGADPKGDDFETDEWENTMFAIDYESMEGGILENDGKRQPSKCNHCTAMVNPDSKFCINCGKLGPQRCTECHALLAVSGNSTFCSVCGTKHKK